MKLANAKRQLIPVCKIKTNWDFGKDAAQKKKFVGNNYRNSNLSNRTFGRDLTNIIKNNTNLSTIGLPNALSKAKSKLSLRKSDSLLRVVKKKSISLSKTKSIKLSSNITEKKKLSFRISKSKERSSLKTSLSSSNFLLLKQKDSFSQRNNRTQKNSFSKQGTLNKNSSKLSFCHSQRKLIPLPSTNKKNSVGPGYVKEYFNDIFENLLKEEKAFLTNNSALVSQNYMENQKEINAEMRAVLVNWLVDVHLKFKHKEQTLFLCVDLIDRYLSCNQIEREKFQLVGISALFIACKHEEVVLPNPKEFIFITENAYTFEELYGMEYEMLKQIDFCVMVPTMLDFFQCYSIMFSLSHKEDSLGRYLINCVTNDCYMTKYTHSLVALSSAYISVKHFRKTENKEMTSKKVYNTINEIEFKDCIRDIIKCQQFLIKSTEFTSVRDKFEKEEYDRVSLLVKCRALHM